MTEDLLAVIAIFGAATVLWGAFGGRLERLNITGPMFFVGVGLLVGGDVFDATQVAAGSEAVLLVAEITLALLLFSDAARLGVKAAVRDSGPALRMLVIGLPLVILAGWGTGLLVLDELLLWEAAILAAILAPTDAALGKSVVESPVVPRRVRNALNIESGLNDGLTVPFFTLFLALAIEEEAAGSAGEWVRFTLEEIGFGALTGIVVGGLGATVLSRAGARGWTSVGAYPLAPIGLSLAAWASADPIGGNGFIAAFVAGLMVKGLTSAVEDENLAFADTEGRLSSDLVFFLFGIAALGPALGDLTWPIVVYAILSLSVVRMVPIAVALIGTGFGARTVAFMGWFGPRGLASIVLGLTLFAERTEITGANTILTTTALVVALSVVLHGISSRPLSEKYGATDEAASVDEEAQKEPSVPTRYETQSEG